LKRGRELFFAIPSDMNDEIIDKFLLDFLELAEPMKSKGLTA
jgi:hypothetical protein